MSKWTRVGYGCEQNPGCWDTGNGAIKVVLENGKYPGVEKVVVTSYCGRSSDNGTYYRVASDTRKTFTRPQDALAAARVTAKVAK